MQRLWKTDKPADRRQADLWAVLRERRLVLSGVRRGWPVGRTGGRFRRQSFAPAGAGWPRRTGRRRTALL